MVNVNRGGRMDGVIYRAELYESASPKVLGQSEGSWAELRPWAADRLKEVGEGGVVVMEKAAGAVVGWRRWFRLAKGGKSAIQTAEVVLAELSAAPKPRKPSIGGRHLMPEGPRLPHFDFLLDATKVELVGLIDGVLHSNGSVVEIYWNRHQTTGEVLGAAVRVHAHVGKADFQRRLAGEVVPEPKPQGFSKRELKGTETTTETTEVAA